MYKYIYNNNNRNDYSNNVKESKRDVYIDICIPEANTDAIIAQIARFIMFHYLKIKI